MVDNVSKIFEIRDGRGSLFRKNNPVVESLRDVNFLAREGDFVGIIGKNGSGKSTLLNLIAGNETATRGSILVSSQPILLGISAALKPQLSGRENVLLGLLAMGATPDFVEQEMPNIINLSGIGEAIDRPMETYSAGMGSRLRFAIATAVRSDILLIDEALSAGDAEFAKRAQRRMDELLEAAGSVLLVTHATDVINDMCNRAVWVHEGEIIADSTTEYVTENYKEWSELASSDKVTEAKQLISQVKSGYVRPQFSVI
ncbi:ABC transporter ATP-binding protein [Corynebacterium pyruviciproducens]|uniref:ABC transporter ATP-binding protein n=1 Tax=Corynebacterium pyruviciproducens TaxID=598660 RepID=UPI00254FDE72|nr:ABC transporter ATP-binding protein [Corynebacterium pyruviciproducens]MDK6565937.1 ABC transporter ATP-binding protein [Corynebacterium pyruviciproducens]